MHIMKTYKSITRILADWTVHPSEAPYDRERAGKKFVGSLLHWDHEPPGFSPSPRQDQLGRRSAGERRPSFLCGYLVRGKVPFASRPPQYEPPISQNVCSYDLAINNFAFLVFFVFFCGEFVRFCRPFHHTDRRSPITDSLFTRYQSPTTKCQSPVANRPNLHPSPAKSR
jgi:hypothetical protein